MADPMFEPLSLKIVESGVEIIWGDNHLTRLGHRFLRGRCGCAGCVDEWTQKRRVGEDEVSVDVKAEDLLKIGNYAVEILWSDLHYEGIYPFKLLRRLCQCSDCVYNRASDR